jgi:hypothetical protein
MFGAPQLALDALSDVCDPCCQKRGISVVDMGLVRSARENLLRLHGIDAAETMARLGRPAVT